MTSSLISSQITSQFDSSIFQDVWQYGLVNISGNDIKISNIIISLILFFTGLRFSKKLTKFILPIIFKDLHNDQDLIYNAERIILSIFWGITLLLSLQIANIPLAIFAFIGGTLAIGIGLGAQGFVNSLINTIIIMLEKPIKIGDIIEIQDVIGKVKSVGIRCVSISSFNNGEVLIPNIVFMQNKLSKWSCDGKIRYSIYVNVPKKEDMKIDHNLVIEQLTMATKDLNLSLSALEPEIYLTKICESEYQFLLKFLCNLKSMKAPELVKDKINFALLKHLNMPFKVEYSENLEHYGAVKQP